MVASTVHKGSDLNLSTRGMIYTLVINIIMFVMLLLFFDFNRHYRQIFLKRMQKRFIDIGRVPKMPAKHMFGWLVAVFKVPELEVLHMVGLDGYMLLRYHTICIKFSLFASGCGTSRTVSQRLNYWDQLILKRRCNFSFYFNTYHYGSVECRGRVVLRHNDSLHGFIPSLLCFFIPLFFSLLSLSLLLQIFTLLRSPHCSLLCCPLPSHVTFIPLYSSQLHLSPHPLFSHNTPSFYSAHS